MRLNRTLLYTGVFLVAIGGAVLAVDLSPLGSAALIDVLRLWPLALIAIGVGIALRRTQVSLASGVLAAAVPGLVLGVAMATAPRIAAERGFWDEFKAAYERHHPCTDIERYVEFGNVRIDPIGDCK